MNADTIRTLIETGLPGARADVRGDDGVHFEATVVAELKPLVHELNQMLSRLEAAQQTQTRFIANAAHQLRTPIAGLVTQLDLARDDASAEHVEKAREAAARLARLAQLLEDERDEGGRG